MLRQLVLATTEQGIKRHFYQNPADNPHFFMSGMSFLASLWIGPAQSVFEMLYQRHQLQ